MRAFIVMMVAGIGTAFGQGSDIYKSLNQKFPGEPAVYVERSEVLNLVLEGDSVRSWSDLTQDMLHLKDQTEMFADRKIYGSSFAEIADIKAKTLVWDKSRYKEMSVTSFKRNDSQSSGIFYDDSYYYSFDFPSVASQSRTLLQYRENIKDIKFISGYMMQSNLPHALSQYTIKASKGIEISYKVLNDRDNRIAFQRTEKGGFVYYQWTAKDLPSIEYNSNAPSLSYFAPYVECHVKSYTTKKGTVKVLSDLGDLHTWYTGFTKNLNSSSSSPELDAVVKDIKTKSKTEMDIVKGVFYWVQDNIKYIALEQGMRGLIPHPAGYVCEKRYGDCKDMANLIVTMLHMAGINNAYRTWIGTRDLPFKYSEFPTPIVDNHMIATYVSPTGEYIFLDGTGNFTKVGYPSSMIQGKEAFISFGDRYELKVVPEISAEQNYSLDSVKVKLDVNKLVGSGKLSYSGYTKVFSGYELDRANQEEVRSAVTKYTRKGSNKFDLQKYEVLNLENRDVPTTICYDFSVSDYFQQVGDEIYLNLNLEREFSTLQFPATRTTPYEQDYKNVSEQVTEFEVPANMSVEYLPENASWDNDLFSFNISYAKVPGKIIYKKRLKVNTLMIDPAQFKNWNEAVKHLSEAYKETIVLKKK